MATSQLESDYVEIITVPANPGRQFSSFYVEVMEPAPKGTTEITGFYIDIMTPPLPIIIAFKGWGHPL